MRLLYLTRHCSPHDARWVRTLASRGLRVGFLPLQGRVPATWASLHSGVELLKSPQLPPAATTAQLDEALPFLRAEVHHWKPQVILAGPLTDAGYLATQIDGERTVLMSWAFDVLHEPDVLPGARDRLWQAVTRARALFADCSGIVRNCSALAGRPFAQVCVLPWGLSAADTPTPRRGWRRRLGDETARVVLHTRGFAPEHQILAVIAAFAQAYERDTTLRLWLAGTGEQESGARIAVEAAELAHAVRFLGELDQGDLAGCYADADVYVAYSLSDGSSVALLQALHAGLPCVAADLPGNREWLEPAHGWLVPLHDSGALAAAITASQAITEERRTQIAGAGRLVVRARADLSANLPRLLATLGAVAAGASAIAPDREFSQRLAG